MYTILINNDNSAVATERQRIMQNSKLIDVLRIIVPKKYNDLDMSEFQAYLEYLTPINHKHNFVTLEIADANYKDDYILYKLAFDTNLTSEVGDVEFYVHFIQATMTDTGEVKTPVRQTDVFSISIIPIANWFVAPDEALSSLDQRLIALQQMIEANADMQSTLASTKLDGLKLDKESKEIYGTVNGVKSGTSIPIEELGNEIADNTNDGMIYVNTFEDDNSTVDTSNGLHLDSETNELYTIVNGKKTGATIPIKELGNAIADNTDDGMIYVNTFGGDNN